MKKYFAGLSRMTKLFMFSALILLLALVLLIPSMPGASTLVRISTVDVNAPAESDILILLGSALVGVWVIFRKQSITNPVQR